MTIPGGRRSLQEIQEEEVWRRSGGPPSPPPATRSTASPPFPTPWARLAGRPWIQPTRSGDTAGEERAPSGASTGDGGDVRTGMGAEPTGQLTVRHERQVPQGGPGRPPGPAEGGDAEGSERAG